jgi:hypothetical protein
MKHKLQQIFEKRKVDAVHVAESFIIDTDLLHTQSYSKWQKLDAEINE